MYKYIVSIKGTDSNDKSFVENIEVEANTDDEAKIKANRLFMIPGPQGLSYKYGKGPNAVIHFIDGAARLN